MRSAQQESEEKGSNQYEKLRKEHIVFIVDEAHRAVSDEEMKRIKKILTNSTWFGLTGTPIFEENKKQENGTFARTTSQQYGPLLHSYTIKNAMDDGAVLGFQVEYHSLISEEDQEVIVTQLNKGKLPDDVLQQEKLLPTELYETDEHIRTMLQKIFNRRSVVKKFKVKNGFPTMSAILTTHSIAQAKHIYRILKEMKDNGTLLNGRQFDERHQLIDKDFPRVAITFSTNPDQLEKNEQNELQVMLEWLDYVRDWLEYNAAYSFTYNYDAIMKGTYTKELLEGVYNSQTLKVLKGAADKNLFSYKEINKVE